MVVNLIANPDTQSRALRVAEDLCERLELPVVNAARAIMGNTREETARKLEGISGLVVPRCVSFTGPPKTMLLLLLAQGSISTPLIVRKAGSHAGTALGLIQRPEDLDRLAGDIENPAQRWFATEFHDVRRPDGLFRKFRAFVVDGRAMPFHLRYAETWNVQAVVTVPLMEARDDLREHDPDFLRHPEHYLSQGNMDTLEQMATRLELDAFGVDFEVLPSGEIILFEATSSMTLFRSVNGERPEIQQCNARVLAAAEEMIISRARAPHGTTPSAEAAALG
ncbi:MAG TPA: hypothetical protein VFE52_03845 [Devosia sp.]|nr:hypothetical protein [Devosia sp.]